jgi:hypothetical protein
MVLAGGPAGAAAAETDVQGSWLKTYPSLGIAGGRGIALAPDGGILVTGGTSDPQGTARPFVVGTDSAGTFRWQVTAGDPACTGTAVLTVPPSAVAVLSSCREASGDAILTILDASDGRVSGSHSYDVDRRTAAPAMATVPGGGFVIAEEADTIVIGRSGQEVILRRVDSEGKPIWDRTFPGTFSGAPAAVLAGTDGTVAVAGPAAGSGVNGTDLLLLLLDTSGNEIGRLTSGTDGDDEPAAMAADGKGGYFLAGTSCRGGKTGTCAVTGIRAGSGGVRAGEFRYPGTGRDHAAAVVAAPDGGYTLVGTTRVQEPAAQDTDILILHVDGNGKELWRRTVGTTADETVGGAVLAPGGSLLVTGSAADPGGQPALFLLSIGNGGMDPPEGLLKQAPAQNTGSGLTVIVRDASTGANLTGARVYGDGNLAGTTSGTEGVISLPEQAVPHRSVRVTMEGYRDQTVPVSGETGPELGVLLQPSPVHRILGSASPEDALDIVFVPSKTSYNCTLRQKVAADRYTADRDAFVEDVRQLTGATLLQVPAYSALPSQIPGDYTRKINVYYYWDGSSFADAFDGCAGSLPGGFWDDAPYADAAVILYPSYGGKYTGSPCEPQGCTNGIGAGLQSWMKVPADRYTLFMHESGHALFGLMDTYCGDTFYAENLPNPNVWKSLANCTEDASRSGWNVSLCRPLADSGGGQAAACTNLFWKIDPAPDLMGTAGGDARYGGASARRIQYIFGTVKGA